MIDLAAITTPYGLLDRETQEALKAHPGPFEYYSSFGYWAPLVGRPGCRSDTYRVKPAPPKPRTGYVGAWHICETVEDFRRDYGSDADFIHVREVLPE